jgi:gamma-glutamylcyclotransferase (GGCT)/AIG2-like uncharacterized protein YtfP
MSGLTTRAEVTVVMVDRDQRMTSYVFLYGTLLPQYAPAQVSAAVARLRPVGRGTVRGLLYDFGRYPGAILNQRTNRVIRGEVFRLPHNPQLLRELDKYEGFNPHAQRNSLFVRRLCRVRLATGRVLRCWIYEYNRKPGTAPVIAGGEWKANPAMNQHGSSRM